MIWICSDNTIKEPLVLLFYKLQKIFTSVSERSHKLLDSFISKINVFYWKQKYEHLSSNI